MILADSGYPALPKLIPVYKNYVGTDQHEAQRRERFNKLAASSRILVEQCIGTLKLRWPYVHTVFRCRIKNAAKIILTCAGLHNFLIQTGSGYLEEGWEDTDEPNVPLQAEQTVPEGEESNTTREILVDYA